MQENVVIYKSTILNYSTCMVSISILIFSSAEELLNNTMIKICTRSPIYLFRLYNLFNKYYVCKLKYFTMISIYMLQCNTN